MMLVDTHAHLNFNAYKNDADEVIKRSLDNNVWMINVGSQYETSKRAVEIAERYPEGVYAAVGLHPIHLSSGIFKTKIDKEEIEFETKDYNPPTASSHPPVGGRAPEEFNYEKYKEIAKSKKVVAIGEVGFDYYWKPKTKTKIEQFKEKQKEGFIQQLKLAQELNLPVIFHCRVAHEDLITTLEQYNNLTIQGVVHCFTGDKEQAEKYLEMGFYLGFNGLIFSSFAPTRGYGGSTEALSEGGKMNFDEIIKKTPLEKILIETDCPYLTPPISENQRLDQPKSAVIRNEPIYVKYVAEKIAKIKNIDFEEVAKITTENAKKLFKV